MHCYDIVNNIKHSHVLVQPMGYISEKKVSDDCQIAKSNIRNNLLVATLVSYRSHIQVLSKMTRVLPRLLYFR
jgi:hypothetical protein